MRDVVGKRALGVFWKRQIGGVDVDIAVDLDVGVDLGVGAGVGKRGVGKGKGMKWEREVDARAEKMMVVRGQMGRLSGMSFFFSFSFIFSAPPAFSLGSSFVPCFYTLVLFVLYPFHDVFSIHVMPHLSSTSLDF